MSVPLGPDENFKVFDENAEIALKEIGDVLTAAVPPGYGFVFLMSTFGEGGNTFYVSNIQRPDVIAMMKEWIEDQQQANKAKG